MKPGISFFFFCFTLSLSFAQGSGPSADEYFEHGKYKEALSAYHQEGLYEEDKEKEFNLAVCQFEVGEFAESRKHFDNLVGQRHEISNCYFYLGRIAHCEQNHTEAIKNYKLFLKRASKKDSRKKQAVAMIKRCAAGLKLSYVPQIAYIENLGPNINTTQDEIAIRQSPNYSNRIYYSSNRAGSTGGMRDNEGLKDEYFGNYSSDILYTENISGTWQEPTPLGSLLNGPKHEIVQDFVNNGQGLIFSKGINPNKGAIYVDTFTNNSDKLQYPSLFESKIVGVLGDKDIQTHNDSTFIFASKRVTGYGAYDLYVTAFRNGEWQEPENLGPEINSDFDEVTPFLTQDGKKLYFSSNNYKSLGGFDVFVSEYNTQEGQWSTPQNLGSPINSSGDEKHYIISKDGMSSMFASQRNEGYGGFDLYIAYLKEQERHQVFDPRPLAFIKSDYGAMSNIEIVESEPVEEEPVEEEVINVKTYNFNALFYDEDEVILTPKNRIELDNIVDLMSLYPEVDLELLGHSSNEGNTSFELYFSIKRAEKAANYIIEKGIQSDRINLRGFGSFYPIVFNPSGSKDNPLARLNRRIDLKFNGIDENILAVKHKALNIPPRLKDTKKKRFEESNQGLSYRIEIARVRNMYQNNNLKHFADVMVSKSPNDQDYLYNVGVHTTFQEAKRSNQKLLDKGFTNIKIVPYIDGSVLPNSRLVDLANQYPDLFNYLKENY